MDPVKTPGFASDCLVMGGKWGWLPLNPIVEKAAPSPNLLSTGTGFIHSFMLVTLTLTPLKKRKV